MQVSPNTSYKSVYTLIRETPMALAELSWSLGLPIRPVPEVEIKTNPWDEANNDEHHSYNTGCEIDVWIEEGQERYLCPAHKSELAHLCATSPKTTQWFVPGEVIDAREETIAQEAARLGIVMRDIDIATQDEDELADIKEEGYQGNTPYWLPDAQIMSMIAWERAVKYSSDVKRIYPVYKGNELEPRSEGCKDADEFNIMFATWLDWLDKEGLNPGRLAVRRQDVVMLSRQFRDTTGKGLTAGDIHNMPEAPKEYFWVDFDPYRETFHETDMEMHDVALYREELSDEQIEELKSMGLPPIGRWMIWTRQHKELDGLSTQLQRALTAISNIALHPIHMNTKMAELGSDHDMANTEWDLGENPETLDINEMYERQNSGGSE